MFTNRQQAGALLAARLRNLYSSTGFDGTPVVVALPRGGVPVALEVAIALDCPLDVLVSKKIGAPGQEEMAIGAVTADGVVVLNEQLTRRLHISDRYINAHRAELASSTREREQRWREAAGMKAPADVRNRTVIVVDDGVATGMTAIAAERSLRNRGAGKIILAAPVIAYETMQRLENEYDAIVTIKAPFDFLAVGQFYTDFHQVPDQEVIEALHSAKHNGRSMVQAIPR